MAPFQKLTLITKKEQLFALVVILVSFFIACSCSQSQSNTTNSSNLSNENYRDYDVTAGDPDTALAVFLYYNHHEYDFYDQYEEYIRWDTEKMNIYPLIERLFSWDTMLDIKISMIEANSKKTYQNSKAEVIDEFKKYGTSSGPWFEYLIRKEDNDILQIASDVLKSDSVPEYDKLYIKNLLKGGK